LGEDASHVFSTGDNVEVTEGELVNLQGRVLAVDGSKVTMQPKHEDLKEPLEFQASELKKFFAQVIIIIIWILYSNNMGIRCLLMAIIFY